MFKWLFNIPKWECKHKWERLAIEEAKKILGHYVVTDIGDMYATYWDVWKCSKCGEQKVTKQRAFI